MCTALALNTITEASEPEVDRTYLGCHNLYPIDFLMNPSFNYFE